MEGIMTYINGMSTAPKFILIVLVTVLVRFIFVSFFNNKIPNKALNEIGNLLFLATLAGLSFLIFAN